MAKHKGDMPMMDEIKPRLYLDLPKNEVELVEQVKVGSKVTFTVTGMVVGVDYNSSKDSNGKETERGSIRIEDYTVKAADGSNDFTKMAEEDD